MDTEDYELQRSGKYAQDDQTFLVQLWNRARKTSVKHLCSAEEQEENNTLLSQKAEKLCNFHISDSF